MGASIAVASDDQKPLADGVCPVSALSEPPSEQEVTVCIFVLILMVKMPSTFLAASTKASLFYSNTPRKCF